MIRFFIIGLGMMGASYAKKLSSLGYQVDGYDKDKTTIKKAHDLGIISSSNLEDLSKADVVILTLYPKDNVSFIKTYLSLFNEHQIITDIAGVKTPMMKEIEQILPSNYTYMSHHPMAGSQKSGFDGLNEQIFKGANFLIINDGNQNDKAYKALSDLASDLEFGNIKVIDRNTHDKMIGFTSQLPHMIAVGLVNSDYHQDTKSFTGDSYRDLTRIASINETLWTELFIENKAYLLKDMELFQEAFNNLYEALKTDDIKTLKQLLISSRKKRDSY